MNTEKSQLFKRTLAVLLSLMMVFSIGFSAPVVSSAAEEEYIAAIGEEKFETLQSAVDASAKGDTITLLGDANGDGVVVKGDKEITFDFGGYTYTVDGKLVGSAGTETQAMQLLKGAKVTLKNGTLKAGEKVKFLVQNYADLTVENCDLDVRGVEYKYAYALSNNCGNILITGESDISSDYVAFDLWYNLQNGYPDGISVTFDENYKGTVTGKMEYGAYAVSEGWLEKTVLTIKNGTFLGEFTQASSNYEFSDANIVVSGGLFSDEEVKNYCAENYKTEKEDDYYRVIGKEYIAFNGKEYYKTLQAAVDASEKGDTITLLGDANGDGVVVKGDKEVIFDFGGYIYTVDGKLVGSAGTETQAMQLLKGAKVTLKNGTLKAGEKVKFLVQNYADLTVENCDLDVRGVEYQYAYALSNNCGNILITGESDISSDYVAFDLWYNLQNGYPDGISVTFDENYKGTVTGKMEYGAYAVSEGWLEKTVLTIKNGTFLGEFTQASSNYEFSDANIVVSGGVFSHETVADYCHKDYKAVEEDSKYKVVAKEYIAAIGEEKFETLQTAVDASAKGDTITLLGNANGDGVVVKGDKEITFDFGGYTYTVDGKLVGSTGTETQAMQLLKGAKVTLKNGTLKAGEKVKFLVQNYADLTVENCDLDVRGVEYQYAYALSNNCGNILITGESDISSDYVAFDLWYNLQNGYPDGISVTFDENYEGTVTGKMEYGAYAVSEGWLEKTVLTIKNGTFLGEFTQASSNYYFKDANIVVSGGRFAYEICEEWCKQGYEPCEYEDGYFGACNHEFTEKIIDGAHLVRHNSCEEGNVYYYDCAKCLTVGTETFDDGNILGHSFTSYIYNDDATCLSKGTKTAICDRDGCNETHTVDDNVTAGHTWSAWIVTKDATCTVKGQEERVCNICGETEKKDIISSHNFSNQWMTDKEATCTVAGSKSHHCLNCSEKKDVTVIAATGHSYYTEINKATPDENGSIVKMCYDCDYESTTVIYKPSQIILSSTSFIYNSKQRKPTVTVKDSKGKVISSSNYTVTYPSGMVNTGKYTIKVAFKGNYSGYEYPVFTILPAATSKLTVTPYTKTLKAAWNKVAGASGYEVSLYQGSKLKSKVNITSTSYTFKKLTTGTNYRIVVKAYRIIDGEIKLSTAYKSVSTATKPSTVSLSKVTAGSKRATPYWKKVSGATGYVVEYSTSKSMKSAKKKTVSGSSSRKVTIKSLKKGKRYYFRVRAYKTVNGNRIYGAYSKVKSVKVK